MSKQYYHGPLPKLGEPFNPFGQFDRFFVPKPLARSSSLSAGAKLAYGRLVLFNGEGGHCYPSLATLGREIGISRDQAKRYVRELRNAHLIRLVSRTTAVGDPDTSEVVFLWHSLFEEEGVGAEMPLGSGTNAPTVAAEVLGGVGAHLPPKRIQLKRVKEMNNSFDHWFNEFWEMYPRKVAKSTAHKEAKAKATTPEKQSQILEGLKVQLPDFLSREPRFVPHPSTWLRQQRWLDEPEPARSPERNGTSRDRHEAHRQHVSEAFDALIARRLTNDKLLR